MMKINNKDVDGRVSSNLLPQTVTINLLKMQNACKNVPIWNYCAELLTSGEVIMGNYAVKTESALI